jgi:hypothetical protein
VDQLLDENGLARSRAAEEAHLAALHERRNEIYDLDPGLERLDLRREIPEGGRIAMDRPTLDAVGGGACLVDRVADDVPEATERRVADWDGDGPLGVDANGTTRKAVGRVHRHGANTIVTEVLLHLRNQCPRAAILLGDLDREGCVDLGQSILKTASMTTPLISMMRPVPPRRRCSSSSVVSGSPVDRAARASPRV